MLAPGDRTLVAVCAHIAEPDSSGMRLADRTGVLPPNVSVGVIAGLCHRPDLAAEAVQVTAAKAVVLVACTGGTALADYRGWLKDWVNPWRVDAIRIDRTGPRWPWTDAPGAAVARRILAGRIARVEANRPARVGAPSSSISWLFDLVRGGRVAPSRTAVIDAGRCLGSSCQLCLTSCPRAALRPGALGRMEVVDGLCDGCGVCEVVCPSEAISLPGASLAVIAAEMRAITAAPASPTADRAFAYGVLLHCSTDPEDDARLLANLPADWIPVGLPCITMVQPGWLLGLLARGASAVGVLACSHVDGPTRGLAIRDRVDLCRQVLTEMGDVDARRRLWASPPATTVGPSLSRLVDLAPLVPRPLQPDEGFMLAEPGSTADAIRRLEAAMGTTVAAPIAHRASPAGTVDFDQGKCTLCGACTQACPTGALAPGDGERGWGLSWNAARCVPCGHCEAVCPEEAIRVASATDPLKLRAGRTALMPDATRPCPTCGRPMVTPAMVTRVRDLLGGDGAFLAADAPLCPACGPGQHAA